MVWCLIKQEIHVFMAWYLVKHWGKLTYFTFSYCFYYFNI